MNSETVEILLATYQGRPYLDAMIASLVAQTHKNWRLLVSDDHSTDGTWEYLNTLAEKESRIILLPRTERLGAIGNFSRLLEHATAPYILFADQDDVWFPKKIALTLSKMKDMESFYGKECPVLIHTDLAVVDENLKLIGTSFWKYSHLEVSPQNTSLNRLLVQNSVTGCTVMINHILKQLVHPIPHSVCMHDWWMALVAVAFGRIGVVSEATLAYRQHGANAIGAIQYGGLQMLRKKWSEGISKMKERREQRFQQVILFQERFKDRLHPKQNEILDAFQEYSKGMFWKKAQLMKRHEFYKSGWLRNLAEFLPF